MSARRRIPANDTRSSCLFVQVCIGVTRIGIAWCVLVSHVCRQSRYHLYAVCMSWSRATATLVVCKRHAIGHIRDNSASACALASTGPDVFRIATTTVSPAV